MPDAKPETRSDWPLIPLFSLIHLLLTAGLFIFAFCALSSPTLWDVFEVMCWVFVFPIKVAEACGLRPDTSWCFPNSLLYGVLWWFSWRMYMVMFRAGPKREG